MILEHAPFGRRGFFASFTLQGVQAGQIFAAAVFLPLAHFMPTDGVQVLGLARSRSCSASSSSSPATSFAAKSMKRPAFAEEGQHGAVPQAPIVQAFKHQLGRTCSASSCMALMNVIPVVATIFGGAYAVQPAYGIGFRKDVYLWIPVLGNILAVIVIPLRRQSVGQDRPPAADHCRRAGFGAAVVRLPLRHQHRERAAGDRHVVADVGGGLPGLQRGFPELLSRNCFPTRTRVTAMAIAQNIGTTITALLPALFAGWRRPVRPTFR